MSLTNNELKKRFKNIKLIVSDIDGTLVNDANEISSLTVDLVKKLKQKNILFSLASQRVHSSIVPMRRCMKKELLNYIKNMQKKDIL